MVTYKSSMPEITLKYKSGNYNKIKIIKSNDAYEFFLHIFNADTIEYLEEAIVLLLNRHNNTIGFVKLSTGRTVGTVVDTKVLFSIALQAGAHAIILAHNHP
jgi:DNA repair protein RadC